MLLKFFIYRSSWHEPNIPAASIFVSLGNIDIHSVALLGGGVSRRIHELTAQRISQILRQVALAVRQRYRFTKPDVLLLPTITSQTSSTSTWCVLDGMSWPAKSWGDKVRGKIADVLLNRTWTKFEMSRLWEDERSQHMNGGALFLPVEISSTDGSA